MPLPVIELCMVKLDIDGAGDVVKVTLLKL